MKTFLWLAVLVIGLGIYGKKDEVQHRENVIKEHRFHLAMPAGDLIASMGQPLSISADPDLPSRCQYWEYPAVVIKIVDGHVVDSHSK